LAKKISKVTEPGTAGLTPPHQTTVAPFHQTGVSPSMPSLSRDLLMGERRMMEQEQAPTPPPHVHLSFLKWSHKKMVKLERLQFGLAFRRNQILSLSFSLFTRRY